MKWSRCGLVGVIVGLLAGNMYAGPAMAQDVTWVEFDLAKARAILREFAIPDVYGPETIFEWENMILQVERRTVPTVLIRELRDQKEKWRTLSADIERELADVHRRVKRDAKIRMGVNILKGVALAATAADKYEKWKAEKERDSDATEGQIRLRQKQLLEKFEAGEWKLLDMKESWLQGKVPQALDNPVVLHMSNRLKKWAVQMPPLLCESTYGGCFEARGNIANPPLVPPTLRREDRPPVRITAPRDVPPDGMEIMKLAAKLDWEVADIPAGYRVVVDDRPVE